VGARGRNQTDRRRTAALTTREGRVVRALTLCTAPARRAQIEDWFDEELQSAHGATGKAQIFLRQALAASIDAFKKRTAELAQVRARTDALAAAAVEHESTRALHLYAGAPAVSFLAPRPLESGRRDTFWACAACARGPTRSSRWTLRRSARWPRRSRRR
jgi:hypothetical protein